MRKKASLLFSLLALSCLAEAAFKTEKPSEMCGLSQEPYRASARHIEGKGIGYTKGYTSVDLFIAPPPTLPHNWVPFVDGRLHVFNSGRIATNIGVGLRYLSSSFVYGINNYYDYRETSHQKYNQYSIGLEALGKVWDFRINGYLPVGAKFSPFYNARFGYFTGNQMMIKGDVQFAMKGLNAEAGIHIKKMKNMEFYGAFGPYYFEKRGQNAIGGKIRLSGTFLNHIKVEGSTSYDPIFHWIGQGELSFVFPFGPNKKIAKRPGAACSKTLRIRERALEPVDRQEIMVLSKENAYAIAIDPRTGQPFKFFFVSNTSHSNSTFEDPLHRLEDAQNMSGPYHVIYVMPGDGTTTHMDQGIILQDHQKLFGSGVANPLATTLGTIVVPALTKTNPTITKSSGNVVTLADNCEVAGFNIVTTSAHGIVGGDLSSFTHDVTSGIIRDNIINVQNAGNAFGIGIVAQGILTISNNRVNSDYRGIKASAIGNNSLNATISDNSLSGSGKGIVVESHQSQGAITTTISRNITTSSAIGIEIYANTCSGSINSVISDNTLSSSDSSSYGVYVNSNSSSGPIYATISGNQVSGGSGPSANNAGILVYSNGSTGLVSTTISGNTAIAYGSTSGGIYLTSTGSSGLIYSTISNNVATVSGSGSAGIWVSPQGSSNTCLSLINNTATPSIVLDNTGSTGSFKLDPVSIGNTTGSFSKLGSIVNASCSD